MQRDTSGGVQEKEKHELDRDQNKGTKRGLLGLVEDDRELDEEEEHLHYKEAVREVIEVGA